METTIIGAEIVSQGNEEGIIIDKARGYCNGASPTVYICMGRDGKVFEVDYNEIKEIKGFFDHTGANLFLHLEKYKNEKNKNN